MILSKHITSSIDYEVYCVVYCLHCLQFRLLFILHTVHTAHCTQCTLHAHWSHCTLYTVHTAHCTLFTLHTVHCSHGTLHTVHSVYTVTYAQLQIKVVTCEADACHTPTIKCLSLRKTFICNFSCPVNQCKLAVTWLRNGANEECRWGWLANHL